MTSVESGDLEARIRETIQTYQNLEDEAKFVKAEWETIMEDWEASPGSVAAFDGIDAVWVEGILPTPEGRPSDAVIRPVASGKRQIVGADRLVRPTIRMAAEAMRSKE